MTAVGGVRRTGVPPPVRFCLLENNESGVTHKSIRHNCLLWYNIAVGESEPTMKVKKPGLIAQILIAIALGALFGNFMPAPGIRALNTFKDVFSQLVKFLVPIIIVGLVTPAIADTGRSAGKLLLATMGIAYASTIFAGYFSFFVSKTLFPLYIGGGLNESAAVAKAFPAYFKIAIPPLADIMTCLVFAFIVGLGITACKSDDVLKIAAQFRDIVTWAIAKFFVPLLPFYVMTVIADTAACGRLAVIAGPCVKLMASCMAITAALLVIQYSVAGVVARRNPFKALFNMLPAYFTGFGCCSSAATIPVTLRQTRKNGVSDDTANLVVPLCANVHLAGSMSNMVAYAIGLIVLAGEPISLSAFTEYILMISVVAVASPGVPGGVVLASATIAETALGFSPERYAIMIAIYMALDGMGTACNLTGDGAIALVVDRLARRKNSG